MRKLHLISLVLLLAGGVAAAAEKGNGERKGPAADERAIARLMGATGGRARISYSPATGAARFVSIQPQEGGSAADLMAAGGGEARAKASQFISEYAGIFGVRDARELVFGREDTDVYGGRHIRYSQYHRGVPVFAAGLRTHFDASGRLTAVNGTVIPDLDVNVTPAFAAADASSVAIAAVSGDNDGREVFARSGLLMIYRAGLVRGVPGPNHLVYRIEVSNNVDVREFVYVDAHTNKIVDRHQGVYDAKHRRAFDGEGANPGPNYPNNPLWVEGDPFPTGVAEADEMIRAGGETYDLFFKPFGRDSYDGNGITMDAIFNRGGAGQCPNASWNGAFISFCPGFATDDVTAHEWGHAYTEYMNGLIYEWQSGALNESYSDIWGETVDRLNGRDLFNFHNAARKADSCSKYFGAPPPTVTVTGGSAAGTYPALISVLEPPLPLTVGPTDMAIAVTGGGFQPTGACGPVSGVSGKIALVNWTFLSDGVTNECGSVARSNNALAAGAAGVIFVAPESGLLNLTGSASIATVEVTHADGEAIKAGLPAQGTITLEVGTDNSARWLIGEDDTHPDLFGALRDMWNPRCMGNPGKVSDAFEFVCDLANDGGGVHINSGIPNHAYALLVDGGTYNGQTIQAIGLTKAAHIYFRAADLYHTPSTDFADHADAIEQAAMDLVGVNLKNLQTGALSGQTITLSDVTMVQRAMLAVEMRMDPPCTFGPPQLGQQPPALCPAGQPTALFTDTFENTGSAWSVSHGGTTAEFIERDWTIVGDLPDDRAGQAFFAINQDYTCNQFTITDQTAVLHLDSPVITIPAGTANPRLTFEHWFATEPLWDGGNLKISVNGGPWRPIRARDFVYNAYNATLLRANQGNSNPLAGETAFSGTDDGQTGGTWGRSIINLSAFAKANDRIRVRFDFGTDICAGRVGWYVDDVQVYRCP